MDVRRLLLITDAFPPAFAPRMGYLCKYLVRECGWNITAIHAKSSCSDHPESFRHLANIVQEEVEYEWEGGINSLSIRDGVRQFLSGRFKFVPFVLFVLGKVCYRLTGSGFHFEAQRRIRKVLTENKYDVILCSSGGCRAYELGEYARRISDISIVQDFRDIIEEHPCINSTWRRKWLIAKRNKAGRECDAIICTAPGHAAVLRPSNKNISVIYNGYDPDVFHVCEPVTTDTFDIVYIGSIYYDTFAVDLFFEMFAEFSKRHPGLKVRVLFYSTKTVFDLIEKRYAHVDCWRNVKRMECVSQDVMPEVFARASSLLLFGPNVKGLPLAITTKAFEYLSSGRPVLDVVSGDDADCEMLVRRAKAGAIVRRYEEFDGFILDKYKEWETKGFVCGTADMEYIKQFSRRTQAEQVKQILEDVIAARRLSAI